MRGLPGLALLLAAGVLSACASSHPALRAWEDAAPAVGCESPEEDSCVVLACEERLCGFFHCEDVELEEESLQGSELEIERVQYVRPGLPMGPVRPGRVSRWSPAMRRGAEPVMTFRWYAASQPPPPPPRVPFALLPAPRLQKHHIFPQAQDLAMWFREQGINIHDYTLLIPEYVHRRIHSGGPSGGLWNEAWREFIVSNRRRDVPREEIFRHAGALIYRFELTGPVVPYYRQFR
ncbi:TIGR02269 family lipoprotein [Pyxidicoccus fallax]|uniref:TIGR02269 family lipoprotein n=1 Tax=Pyxidicoccus fallax TaxID=394095 RepID=A0A848L5P8_9BACT|nr:TIGR02269 family lipoprotein [Pyxidicoccus fallax]NMO14014.1 TIGR02269 family lipoprotein [Pyxidicoccus fallax]NPC76654.1 TIGR02269 family lipoprotein [Pyxidicoccus fallax]